MLLIDAVSMLALRSVVDGALDAIQEKTGLPVKDKAGAAFSYLVDHFRDHGGRLGAALTGANERA